MDEKTQTMDRASSPFRDAVDDFVADWPAKKKRPSFIEDVLVKVRPVTAEDVQEMLVKLERDDSQRKSRKYLSPIFEAIYDYDGVLGTLSQADPMPSALVWGGLKAFIECLRRYTGLFDKVESHLKSLTRHISRLNDYEELFMNSDEMMELLKSSYVEILRFWAKVEEQCSTNRFVLATKSLSSFSTKRLDEIIAAIAENSDNIVKLVPIVSERVRRKEHEDALQERRLAGIMGEEILRRQRDERNARRKTELRQWIGFDILQRGNNNNRQQQHHQRLTRGTGAWLFEDPYFKTWQDPTSSSNVLWLKGVAGVGKSVICAHAIDRIQTTRPDSAVAFYYFSFDESETLFDVYRDIAMQLYHELCSEAVDVSDHAYSISNGAPNVATMKQLIKVFMAELQTTFIFIDGLDEESSDKERWTSASDVVSFLMDVSKQPESPLKLWCSSQDRPNIRELLKECEEIQLGATTNGQDIERFFQTALESKDFAEMNPHLKAGIMRRLKEQVNGNFLWAAFMWDSIEAAVSLNDIDAAIEKGLPQSFELDLKKKVEKLKPEQYGFLSKVLSCLVYAKRRLWIDELSQAIEILNSEDGDDLESSGHIFKGRISDLCAPLVVVDEVQTGPRRRQRVTLAHGSVKKFFMKNPDILSNKENDRVCSSRLAWASLKYLRQPRYGQMLEKVKGSFVTVNKKDIMDHHLLVYCAKYWYRHMDDLPWTPELCKEVEGFVRSPNFVTLLQVQSLLVEGQFMNYYREEEIHMGLQTVRMLPHWFTEHHHCGEDLQRQYQSAIREWGYLLSNISNVNGNYPGQVDRCWWDSLGKMNFLHKAPSQFKSFLFANPEPKQPERNSPMWERISHSGRELDLFKLDDSLAVDGKSYVACERWTLSQGRSPKLRDIRTMEFPSDDLKLYRKQPVDTFFDGTKPVAATEDGKLLRIGPRLYLGSSSGPPVFTRLDLGDYEMDYVQDIACNDRFVAEAYRGRLTENNLKEDEDRRDKVPGQPTEQSTTAETSASSSSDVSSDESSSSDSNSDTVSVDEVELDGTEESHSSNDDLDVSEDESLESNSARESWSEGSTAALSDEIDDEDMWHDFEFEDDDIDFKSDLSNDADEDELEDDGLSNSSSSSTSSSSDAPPSASTFEDDSDDPFDSAYEGDDSDDEDDEGGLRLHDLMTAGPVNPKGPVCEIRVFGNEAVDGKAPYIFRFAHRSEEPLYSSPPVFHPTEDLLVWPLGANEILFANFTQKTYYTRFIRAAYRNSCQISVQCRFSPCGKYLHIASLDGIVVTNDDDEKELGLRLHASTHRLSQKKLARSPPKLVYRTSVDLTQSFSKTSKLSVSNMPFTLVWTESHVFLTESNSSLRVHRIPLYSDVERRERSQGAPRALFVNEGDVFLPESAELRKVYFFPTWSQSQNEESTKASERSKSKKSRSATKTQYVGHVLLGAQSVFMNATLPDLLLGKHGHEPIRPQGAHLTAEQLGGWKGLDDKRDLKTPKRAETWRGGQLLDKFEKFDHSEDCDIVPYLRN